VPQGEERRAVTRYLVKTQIALPRPERGANSFLLSVTEAVSQRRMQKAKGIGRAENVSNRCKNRRMQEKLFLRIIPLRFTGKAKKVDATALTFSASCVASDDMKGVAIQQPAKKKASRQEGRWDLEWGWWQRRSSGLIGQDLSKSH